MLGHLGLSDDLSDDGGRPGTLAKLRASLHAAMCKSHCFPAWQLDRDGRPYAALPKLHEILSGAWAVYRFLVSAHGALEGRTGLDALKRGQDSDVIAAAEGIACGDFR
nr:hypothetical protein [Agrobacterium rubi]